jgi:hypothetical protein
MKLYGLYVWTHHGWGTVLTVMSPEGIASGGDGRLPRYMGRRGGVLDDLVERYGIRVLAKAEWDAKKAELADGDQNP